MKRILIDGMSNNMGGIEKFVHTLYEILKDDCKVDFITVDDKIPFEEEFKANGSNIFRITPRYVSVKNYKKDIDKVFKMRHYDVLWFNKTTLSSIDCLKAAKKNGVSKIICHSHSSQNMGGKFTMMMHCLNRKRVGRFIDQRIACSPEAAEWFFGKNHKNVMIFQNAVDIKKYEPDQKIREKIRYELGVEQNFVIGHIGRFSPEKNHKFLIDIFEKVSEQTKAVLLLCGDGALKNEIQEYVKEKQLVDRIFFLGIRNDINRILQAIDCIVFPSVFEGLPFALVEAQAAGVPCVISDTVSKDAGLTELVHFLSLDAPLEEWRDTVLNYKDYRKVSVKKQLADKGYSLDVMKQKVREIINS